MLDRLAGFWRWPAMRDEEEANAARLLRALLAVSLAGTIVFAAASLAMSGWTGTPVLIVGLVLVMILAILVLFFLLRRGHVRATSRLLLAVLWVAFTLPALQFGGLHDTAIAGWFLVVVIAGVAGGTGTLVFFVVLSLLAVAAMFAAENMGFLAPVVAIPTQLNDLALLVVVLLISAFILIYAVRNTTGLYRRARQSALAAADSQRELQASNTALRQQTLILERRTRYLEATGVVARQATLAGQQEEAQRLSSLVVSLISDQFGFYHTGLFLLDATGEWAELRAASSEGGQRMMDRGHRLRVGYEGVVGHAAAQGRAGIAQDVGEGGTFVPSPELPETRSEVALPLQIRNRIVGVLDVQSRDVGAFGEEDLAVLQGLADQVAVVLDNASLLEQLQKSLAAERRGFDEASRVAWQDLLSARRALGFVSDRRGTAPQAAAAPLEPQMETALRTGQVSTAPQPPPDLAVAGAGDGEPGCSPSLAVPIKVRDQVIGVVDGRKSRGQWTAEEIELLTALTGQLSLALEGARLYGEAQNRAARDQLLSQVTASMRRTLDLDMVLETAVREMRAALGIAEVSAWLDVPEVEPRP